MNILKKILITIGFASIALQSANAGTIEDITKRGELRVGLSTFVPWAFVNKNGELIGFEVDVAKQLAKDLGVKVKIVNTAWDGIIPALQSKKFDVIISGMSVTTKRNIAVNFTTGYAGTEYVVLAQPKHKKKSLASFNNRSMTFAARRGAITVTLIKKHFPKAKLLQFDDDGVAVQELLNGNVDAVVETDTYASTTVENNSDRAVFINDGKALYQIPSAFAVRKGDHDTLNLFDNWIKAKKNNGWLQERADYWFKTKKWAKEMPK